MPRDEIMKLWPKKKQRSTTPNTESALTGTNSGAKRGRGWLWLAIALIMLAAAVLLVQLLLGPATRAYVNRVLDRSPLYAGEVGKVQIALWRGAYAVQDVRINKLIATLPVPLFKAERVEFSLQWKALWHRRLVGTLLVVAPEINFVDVPGSARSQPPEGGSWLQTIQDLSPFTLDRAVVERGSVHFRVYQVQKPVDVYLSELEGSVENLGNIRNDTAPLFSTVRLTGSVMDQAEFTFSMKLDPHSYRPTFHLVTQVLGLDVTKLNDLATTYGRFDFQGGWLDFVLEADAKEGRLTGYAKPLFRHLQVFDLEEDTQSGNPLQIFWEALLGVATTLLSNPERDQFGTLIPFRGDLTASTTTDLLATLVNILHNAFVRAFLPRPEGEGGFDFLQFQTPELTDIRWMDE
jgi:hypothetical protein